MHRQRARLYLHLVISPPATDSAPLLVILLYAKPLDARRWTEVVQAVLKRQAGVAFAPKDLRSSFITFLLSEANPDEALKKAVAQAMRHSTALQGSATYDKERAERTWASAVQVAGAYAARFE